MITNNYTFLQCRGNLRRTRPACLYCAPVKYYVPISAAVLFIFPYRKLIQHRKRFHSFTRKPVSHEITRLNCLASQKTQVLFALNQGFVQYPRVIYHISRSNFILMHILFWRIAIPFKLWSMHTSTMPVYLAQFY